MSILITEADDEQFVNTAIKLGYTRKDLQKITYESVEQQSINNIKGLTELQKKYYLQKKCEAMLDRQHKIILKVSSQMQKVGGKKYKKGFNPIIKKLLEQHEIALQKKARYVQKQQVRISKTRDASQHRKVSNTIDFGRTSPNFSQSSKHSRISQASRISSRSQNSQLSSKSNTSHKERLNFVRMKEKQAQQYKKEVFRYNQNQIRRRKEKVQESRLSLSRRLKTKSQISQQAAKQKKDELNKIKNDQIRDHIQRLKYKMIRNEYIKQKQQEKKLDKSAPFDGIYKRQLKKMFDQNEKQSLKFRYQSKLQSNSRNKKEIQKEKMLLLKQKLKQKQMKQMRVLKFQQHKKRQEEERKRQTLYYEMQDLEKAKNKKLQIQSEKKMRLLQNRVQQEIVRTNFNSIQARRKLETKDRMRQFSEKIKQIDDIQNIKRKLTRERKRTTSNRIDSQDFKFSFY